jgi:hypothetical protein
VPAMRMPRRPKRVHSGSMPGKKGALSPKKM